MLMIMPLVKTTKSLLLRKACLLPLLLLAPVCSAAANDNFSACIKNLQAKARTVGISDSVIERDLASVRYINRVIELDRRQPEFTQTFTHYFERRVTEERVQQGRQLLAEHRPMLNSIQGKYGVPPQYLLAFWGLETNFGGYKGKMPTLDSLATLACDPRRSDYFTDELMAALRIVDEGVITADNMQGSWAGAMGHMQFMPHVFLRYAVDADDDGRRDLWNSIADAMHSAANFLSGIGWQEGMRWGREVRLPEGFTHEIAGLDQPRPLAEWRQLGLRTADNRPLPVVDDMQAALLVPSGHEGPKFLVYDNFRVIMRWNRSEFYALAVGHLADRINGAGKLRQPPPENAVRLDRQSVITLQQTLNDRQFEAGEADGVLGPATRSAIRRFQKHNSMIADGFVDNELLKALNIDAPEQNR